MRGLLKYDNSYEDEEVFADKYVTATRTRLGCIGDAKQPFIANDRYYAWLEGEFYNQDELRKKYNLSSESDIQFLVDIYQQTKSFGFLRDIDGYYVAVIYDSRESKIYLITDRFGFKPMYWTVRNQELIWSSELKGLLGHVDFNPKIDPKAVEEFLDIGYLLENRTWFEGVEMVPPSSVLIYDISGASYENRQYWSWHNIRVMSGNIDENEIVEETGRLFLRSVRKRARRNERIGVALSGGLDSRAVLAAVPEDQRSLHAFTFGIEGCDDMVIAEKVSKRKGAKHHAFILNEHNWLLPRLLGVWQADGAISVLHMHGIEFRSQYRQIADVCLNGFAGDLILGGSYLKKYNIDKPVSAAIVRRMTHCEREADAFNRWYDIQKSDPYFINNRVRRFTHGGLVLLSKTLEPRMPFWDIELADFVYGLPDRLRYKNYIYSKMLLKTFPEYYADIPWQKTGSPISKSLKNSPLETIKNSMTTKINRGMEKLGLKPFRKYIYTDYPAWIRQGAAKTLFENVLRNAEPLYSEYVAQDRVEFMLDTHLKGRDRSEMLCRYLTLEIWLQQVFNKKYRNEWESKP